MGASTGTNVWGALQLAAKMRDEGRQGAIVTLLCDSGERYLETYYNPQWVEHNIGDLTPWQAEIKRLCAYKKPGVTRLAGMASSFGGISQVWKIQPMCQIMRNRLRTAMPDNGQVRQGGF